MDLLPTLDLPIYIFHGMLDQNCDVAGVYKIRDRFIELGKSNLEIHVFENHNHDLNYMDIISKGDTPIGILTLLDKIVVHPDRS